MCGSNNLVSQTSWHNWYHVAQLGPLLDLYFEEKQNKVVALHDRYDQLHENLHAGQRFLFMQLSCVQLH